MSFSSKYSMLKDSWTHWTPYRPKGGESELKMRTLRAALPLVLLMALFIGVSTAPRPAYGAGDACQGCCDGETGCNFWAQQFGMECDPGYMNYLDCEFTKVEEDFCQATCWYSPFHCDPDNVYIACLVVEQ